jgi:hypothetical protein
LFIAKGSKAAREAPPAPCGLSELSTDLIDLVGFESQPFQEALVAGWMTALEQFMPLFPLRLVQADFLEHRDPFFYVYVVLHIYF